MPREMQASPSFEFDSSQFHPTEVTMSKSALFVSLFIAYSIGAKPVYGQPDIRRDHVQISEECSEFGGCRPYLVPIDSMGGWPISLRVEEGEILSSAIIEAGFGTSKQTSLRLLPLGDTFVGVAEVGGGIPIEAFSFGWAEVRRINRGNSGGSFAILSSAMSYARDAH